MKTAQDYNKKPIGWFEFIRWIISFFWGRKKYNEEKAKSRLKKAMEELNKEYKNIDNKTEKKKNEDSLSNRLNDMF